MATRAEFEEARKAFGEWFPRHGVLTSGQNNLYVALHKAHKAGQLTRQNLASLGESLKTALAKSKREEVQEVVKTAEAIHNAHGLRHALSYLRGELNAPQVALLPAAIQTTGKKRSLTESIIRLRPYRKNLKPSELLAQIAEVLSTTDLRKILRKSHRHRGLLDSGSGNLYGTEYALDVHLKLASALKLDAVKLNEKLYAFYDFAHPTVWPNDLARIIERMQRSKSLRSSADLDAVVEILRTAVKTVREKAKGKRILFSYTREPFEKVHSELTLVSDHDDKQVPLPVFKEIVEKQAASFYPW